ncbi:uncharacterized protein LOC129616531 [Condylostylus longicornis]|uniref:uncharacterized protein LOC129616531 n=1 Tax=Condylostylus longicornis TaxID=2530218 RepID=UPI00244E42B9|nr:uncharacterized protein LOC129616531 [Condylostylus longicornis]
MFLIIFLIVLIIILYNLNKDYNLLAGCRRIKTVNGLPLYGVYPSSTIFGNNFDIFNLNEEKLFNMVRQDAKNAKRSYFKYIVANPVYEIIKAEDAELVVNNTTIISKSRGYEFLQPFLGTGLLTSTHQKWHARRKLLTPSFHFNILQKFLETFKDESYKFITNIKNQPSDIVNLSDVIPKFTLNTVCETALGVNLDDIGKSEEYRKNISATERFFMMRIFNPIKYFDFLYEMFEECKIHQNVVNELHKFSSTIIKLRRNIFQNKNKSVVPDSTKASSKSDDDIYFFKKERRAMLDTLLEAEEKNLIDHQGICEEVDTFMFEGFDTTSAGLMFTILCLATYQEVQEKCYEEILQLQDDLSDLLITDINNLQYLDCVIKESLRLYPPVPLIARKTDHEVIMENYILPKGLNININIYDIHRDPHYFPNPEVFDPSRFLPENSIKRHPYSYIPFSAGARNCIGQKFALLEIKVLIINLLRNYKLYPKTKIDEIVFQSGLILRSKFPIEVRLTPRYSGTSFELHRNIILHSINRKGFLKKKTIFSIKMILVTIFLIIIVIILWKLNKNFYLLAACRRIKTVNGDLLYGVYPSKTIFGHSFDYIFMDEAQLFQMIRNNVRNAKRSYFRYVFANPIYDVNTPEDVELILNNTTVITKSRAYEFLHTFLGTGLLTSTHEKWHSRRKLLTPSFHFNILQRFLETFKDESKKFITNLKAQTTEETSLSKIIPEFTLNSICETALGVNLDDIGESKKYHKNITATEKLFVKRLIHPLKYFDITYKMFKEYQTNLDVVNELHKFSSTIINLRRNIFQNKNDNSTNSDDDTSIFKKKRRAMLDTLLEAEEKKLIDHEGICEEVDTFMFEGFDTTSAGLMFTILCLATYQEIQEKCYEDILQLPDDFSELTIADLNNLQYLECVIKESLRLYPPVPLIARKTDHEVIIGDLILPKGLNIFINIYDIHRNSHHFPNPETFDPDRFLPENSINRHPYAYIPFSAGSRNCIGQKFAMLEMKILLANLLKNYKIYPKTKIEDLVFEMGLILRSRYPIEVYVKSR